MFVADHKTLRLSFNEFHELTIKDMPEYGEYCLLELKDGNYTAGEWHPASNKRTVAGMFLRGTADTVDAEEVARWHSLERYNLTECLEDEEIGSWAARPSPGSRSPCRPGCPGAPGRRRRSASRR